MAWPTCLMWMVRENEAFWPLYPCNYSLLSVRVSQGDQKIYPDPILLVRNVIGRNGRMMATEVISIRWPTPSYKKTYLTCSEMSLVVPASSSHSPKKSSPKNGFRGFFSEPSTSLRLQYCCLRVLKNHFRTSRARLAGSFSRAGATKRDGCSAQ